MKSKSHLSQSRLIALMPSFFTVSIVALSCTRPPDFDVVPDQSLFQQSLEYNNKVDIIWLIDDSFSMAKYQEDLAREADLYMDQLRSRDWDFRIAVITTDYSQAQSATRRVGQVLTPQTPNLSREFRDQVLRGEGGSNREMGLQSLYDFMIEDREPFLRDEAFLLINILSDEEDSSFSSPSEVKDFLDFRKRLVKDFSRGWMANFIGVLSANGSCRTFDSHASPGHKYIELVDASGGFKDNICDRNFKRAIEGFQSVLINILTDFKLDRDPVLETLRVFVNGEEIAQDSANGWTYLPETKTIRFHGRAVPPARAEIKVDFVPALPK